MKIEEIMEMAYPTTEHPEFSLADVDTAKNWLLDAREITKLEGGKFTLVHKSDSYALKRTQDGEIIGWIIIGPLVELFGRQLYPLINIQILPQYRNSAASMILINAVREVLDHPVIVDGPIFTGGQRMLNAIAKRPMLLPNILTVNKSTGKIKQYEVSDLTSDDSNAFILESSIGLIHQSKLPGGNTMPIILELFGTVSADLLLHDNSVVGE